MIRLVQKVEFLCYFFFPVMCWGDYVSIFGSNHIINSLKISLKYLRLRNFLFSFFFDSTRHTHFFHDFFFHFSDYFVCSEGHDLLASYITMLFFQMSYGFFSFLERSTPSSLHSLQVTQGGIGLYKWSMALFSVVPVIEKILGFFFFHFATKESSFSWNYFTCVFASF